MSTYQHRLLGYVWHRFQLDASWFCAVSNDV